MTYSIIATDPASGAVGVATATGSVAVGGFVPHVRCGQGAIATQGAFTNWLYGDRGLALLNEGLRAHQVRDRLIEADEGQAQRQLIVCDRWGNTAGHTGSGNLDAKLHLCEPNFAVAGNMLNSTDIVLAMKRAFQQLSAAPLHDRLLASMMEGERIGGDFRGTHSAALKVHYSDKPPVDLRVDWAERDCIEQLKILYHKTQSEPFQDFLAGVPTLAHPTKTGHVNRKEVR